MRRALCARRWRRVVRCGIRPLLRSDRSDDTGLAPAVERYRSPPPRRELALHDRRSCWIIRFPASRPGCRSGRSACAAVLPHHAGGARGIRRSPSFQMYK